MDVVRKPQDGGVPKLRGPTMSMIKSTLGMQSWTLNLCTSGGVGGYSSYTYYSLGMDGKDLMSINKVRIMGLQGLVLG
jgi:hypothetical protein